VPLPLAGRLRVARRDDGVDVAEVHQEAARLEILPGVQTDAITYGGTFPGPLVESRTGVPLLLTHHNDLDVDTVVHLHGGHTATASDGYPTDLVAPGESREYTYPMTQRAATLWYHDHAMDRTGPHVYGGLLGLHVVRDDDEDALPLPRSEHEVPLVIVDRSFDEHGQFQYPSMAAKHGPELGMVDDDHVEGVLGDVILVNGAPWPELEVDAARYRLRILNRCNARRLELALAPPPPGGAGFVQVGSDGGLLARPVTHDVLPIAQAERFDVVVDFSRYAVGTRITMVNRLGSGATGLVMRFVVARRGADDSAPAARLPALPEIEPLNVSGATVRQWRFTRGNVSDGQGGDTAGWTINDRVFDPDRIDARVPLGRVERWQFLADLHHPVHVHLNPFQVLGRAGGDPKPADAGWKDTVSLRPGEMVEVATRFDTHAGQYLIHCHNLEHEDRMMMAAFETYQT
jgi:spore coat protein A, manganese oxidase